jgi:transposase
MLSMQPQATSRRRRRTKTDRIDGETLLRALLAHKRGRTAGLLNGSGTDA